MNTEKYISWLQARTGNQVTRTELLDLVNIAQNEIFSWNTYYNRVKPQDSLVLTTIAGVFQYTVPDTNIRMVSKVYLKDSINTYPTERRYYQSVVPVETQESIDPDSNVVIYFKDDPGATTDTFYYEAYTWPFNGQLTSEAVPLSLPETIQTGLLYYCVAVLLELDRDGRSISFLQLKDTAKGEFFTSSSKGARIQSNTPKPSQG